MVQVNQWLTWLETAEEEESEGEDYWGTGQSHVLSGCNEWFFFFLFFYFNFSCLQDALPQLNPFPLVVYKYFPTTVTIHSTMKCFARSSQHHHLIVFMLFFLIFNLIWCPTPDVLYISIILGYVFSNSRQYCAGNCTSTKPDPFYHLLHLVGVTKCCHNY